MRTTRAIISLIMLLMAAGVLGQTISTQGVLRDSDGHSVEDGDYAMTFSIYDMEAGGTLLWGPSSQTVAVENGIYHVVLGEDAPITSFNSDGGNFLQISVENEIMTPRLRLNVSPYELANLTGSSNTFPGGGNTGIGTTNPQAKLSIVAPGDNVDLIHLDEDGDDLKEFTFQGMFAGGGSSGNGLKLRSQWIDKIMFWRGDGNVGIGTESPSRKLTVDGGIQATGRIGNIEYEVKGQEMIQGDEALTTLRFDSDNYRIHASGPGASGALVTLNETGKLGIGVSEPETKLHIAGGSDVGPAEGGFIQTGSSSGANIGIDDNEIMARNNGEVSTLYVNPDGGTVSTGADINVKHGSSYLKPFQFARYSGSGENCTIPTSYSGTDWIAAVVGFDAGVGDLDESGANDLWQINCAVASNGNWEIFCDAPTHSNYPEWQIYVMFVSTKFGYATSGYKSH